MTSRLTRVGAFFVFAAASTHTVDEALQGLAAAHGNVHVVTRNSNLADIQAFLACKGVPAAVHCVPRSSGRSKADVILSLLPEPAVGVFVDDRCPPASCPPLSALNPHAKPLPPYLVDPLFLCVLSLWCVRATNSGLGSRD